MFFKIPDKINIDLFYVIEGKLRFTLRPLSNQTIPDHFCKMVDIGPGEYFDYHKLLYGEYHCDNTYHISTDANRVLESI